MVSTEQDVRYGEPQAPRTEWETAQRLLTEAKLYWITTRRPEGTLHTTPLVAVWLDGAVWFCTGDAEQKYVNLAADPHCAFLTGTNELHEGIDVVLEGVAEPVSDESRLHEVAAAFLAKYGEEWRFEVVDGRFQQHAPGTAVVFRVPPASAHAFGKAPYSQTAYRF